MSIAFDWESNLPWFYFLKAWKQGTVPERYFTTIYLHGTTLALTSTRIYNLEIPPCWKPLDGCLALACNGMPSDHSSTGSARLQTVCRASLQLSKYMPESFPGEHLFRAEMLCRTGSNESHFQFLEVKLFLLSNNHIFADDEWLGSSYISDARLLQLVKALQSKGPILRVLFDSKLISAQAVCEKIFGAAVREGDLEILSIALQNGFDPNRPVLLKDIYGHKFKDFFHFDDKGTTSASPFMIALYNRKLACCKLLLAHGANQYSTGYFSRSMLLEVAVRAYENSSDDLEVLKVVLSWHTNIHYHKKYLWYYRNTVPKPVLMLLDPYFHWSRKRKIKELHETSLILAIRFQDISGLNALLDNGADPNTYSLSHKPAFCEAILTGRLDICQILLSAGANLSLMCHVGSILEFASISGNTGIVKLCLEHGADVNAKTPSFENYRDHDHWYMTATEHLENPPDNWMWSKGLMRKRSALYGALYHSVSETSHILLDNGAVIMDGEISVAIEKVPSILTHMFDSGAYFDTKTERKESILGAAIRTLQFDLVSRIMESDRTRYDPWAVCAAVWIATRSKDIKLVDRLLSRRKLSLPENDLIEGTALGIAITAEDWAILELFHAYKLLPASALYMGYKAELEESLESWAGKGGWWSEFGSSHTLESYTLLQIAGFGKNKAITKRLFELGHKLVPQDLVSAIEADDMNLMTIYVDFGADLNEPVCPYETQYGRTASLNSRTTLLEIAIKRGRMAIARRLVETGADVNGEPICQPCRVATDRCYEYFSGRTPVQAAVEQGDLEMIEFLLSKGAWVNAPAALHMGATALQIASIKGYIGIARRLLAEKADCNAQAAPYHGRTALEAAAEHGRIEMIQILLNWGVRTEGAGSRQYYRAIKFAERECHYAAGNLLRKHREWTDEDHRLYEEQDLIEGLTEAEAEERGHVFDFFNVFEKNYGTRMGRSYDYESRWRCPCEACPNQRVCDDRYETESTVESPHEVRSGKDIQSSEIEDHLDVGEMDEYEEAEDESRESESEEGQDSFSAMLGNRDESPNTPAEDWMQWVDFSGGQAGW